MSQRKRDDSRPTFYLTADKSLSNRRQISLREGKLRRLRPLMCMAKWHTVIDYGKMLSKGFQIDTCKSEKNTTIKNIHILTNMKKEL